MVQGKPLDVNEAIKALTDEGKIIQAGWVGMFLTVIPPSASHTQVTEMRKAFFLGAQHLFSTIINMLEPGEEATEKDEHRMTMIHNELIEFSEGLKKGRQ